MVARRIVVDPMTRIEGHLRFETRMNDGVVADAKCSGDMYRGIEKGLIGYDARVAQQVTQRVCGVCPYAHAEAAAIALENAMGLKISENGQLLRNLTVGAYHLQDYLLHFYALCALDFIDVTAIISYQGRDAGMLQLKSWVNAELQGSKVFPAAPFLPRYQAAYAKDRELNLSAIQNYLGALPVMSMLHKMVALFGGKAPHPVAIEAGGVTTMPTIERLARYRQWLGQAGQFIRNNFQNDVVGVAKACPGYFKEGRGYGNLLSYPWLPDRSGKHHFAGGTTINGHYAALDIGQITEDHTYAFYNAKPNKAIKPLQLTALLPIGYDEYQAEKKKEDGKYTWTRAPRYGNEIMEVGPVARVVNTYHAGTNPELNKLADKYNKALGISIKDYNSVMGRHLSRLISALITLETLEEQLEQIVPEESAFIERPVPKNARGVGLTEATRGGLAHWIETDDKGLIKNYEMIVPTTWNMSPRDADGRPGPVEKMLIGTRVADAENPMELARIIRSTDPCMACSVH
jgi:Ni,Fe-hydrogenase I large subunit